MSKVRHPTENKSVFPTPSDPNVSIGKLDKEILKHLALNKNSRFNIKEYARINKIARTNVYDSLARLIRYEFVVKDLSNHKITERGNIYLESTNQMGVGGVRKECRTSANLSTHLNKFKLQISDVSKFRTEKISLIKNKGYKENRLCNLHQTIISFEDATVTINPKQVIITLYDILTDNTEDSDQRNLSRAVGYAELLRTIGVQTEGIMIESGHWARVESFLSDWIYDKIDTRYFLTLSDGSRFWIDHSHGKNEDETDSKILRQKVDTLLNDVIKTEGRFSDIDKINESLGFITKLEATRLMKEIEENKRLTLQLEIKKNQLNVKSPLEDFKSGSYIG